MDHNDKLGKALKDVQSTEPMFDGCITTLCWAHISLQALQANSNKFQDRTANFDEFQSDLLTLHYSRSHVQFKAISQRMIREWNRLGEVSLAEWFQNEYLHEDYYRWFITCSGIIGHTPNNNCVESYHRNDKRTYYGFESKHNYFCLYISMHY